MLFGLSAGLNFGTTERGEEVKCTKVTFRSMICIELFTVEGILPR